MKGLQSIKKQAQQISDEFIKMGATITKVGVAMAIPLALATKKFADFDDQMRTVKAVSQSSEAEFQKLTETAKRLGATTSFTAVEVAQMMTELGRAGFTADQIDVMTAAVLNLSRATGTEGALAAGIMAASIRQFGLGASEATRVADGLTAAANKSFNSVESLGEAMSYVGPVAADMGMSIEETLAILGGLGNIGIQGSSAGTAFKRLLTITAAEADKLKGIFGVSFLDAAGNARPLIDTLEEVNKATANMGTGERASKFNEAFGLLGITAAGAIGKNSISIKQLYADIKKAGGIADDTAKQMDAGLGGSFRILLSAVEGVAIAIGESLAPVLMEIGNVVIPILGAFTKWIKENQAVVKTVAAVAAGVIALGGALLSIGVVFGALSFAIAGLGSLFTLVSGTLSIIATGLGLLLTPVGILVGLGVVLAGLVAYWLTFTDEGNKAARSIMEAFRPVKEFLGGLFQGVFDALVSGDLELAAQITAKGIEIAFMESLDAVIRKFSGFFMVLDSLSWIEGNLSSGFNPIGDTNKLIGETLFGDHAKRRQQLEDMKVIAALDRDAAAQKGWTKKTYGGGSEIPGTGGGYAPDAVANGIAESMKSFGSFDANALVLQNWGGFAPKADPQKQLLDKLDEIYAANVGVVPALEKVKEAVVRGYVDYDE